MPLFAPDGPVLDEGVPPDLRFHRPPVEETVVPMLFQVEDAALLIREVFIVLYWYVLKSSL